MIDSAPLSAEGAAGRTSLISATGRWRRPPAWLWGASFALQVLAATLLTNFSFFLVDDYEFLNEARRQSFTLGYLREPLYEHFSPVSRALDKLLVTLAPGSFALAHGVELALYAAALIAFALLIGKILGNSWGALAFTIVFGQSIFLIRLLYWWTATANILPATVFILLALWCYLRWRETGSSKLLAGSFASYALALLDYETAILFPAYLAVITLLVLERRPGPRAWAATLWRERRAWAGYALLDAAALANFYGFYYYRPVGRTRVPELAHYLVVAFVQTFIPALVGIRFSHALLPTLAAAVVLLIGVGVTLYLRPRAWRCVAGFLLIFLITMLPVGLDRVGQFGVKIGQVIYYQQSVQFMFLVLAAFAISPRWSGRRTRPAARRLGRPRGRALALTPWRRILTVGAMAAVAAYAVLYLSSVKAMQRQVSQEVRDRAYVSNYLASDKQLRRSSGREPVLVDLDVPISIFPRHLAAFPTYRVFLGLFNPRMRVDEIARPVYVLSSAGELAPARLEDATRGSLGHATATRLNGSDDAAASRGGGARACAPTVRSTSWLHVPLARPERVRAHPGGLAYVLEVRYRMPRTASVSLRLIAGRQDHDRLAGSERWRRGSGGVLIPLSFTAQRQTAKRFTTRGTGGERLPLRFTGKLREVNFRLPAGACVTGLRFGRLGLTRST